MSERFAPERLCALGLAVNGAALVFLSFLAPGASATEVVLGLALLGVGMGLFQTPNNNLLMTSVPRERLGVGSAFLSIVRSLGYSIGTALATIIVSANLLELTGQTSLQQLRGAADAATNAQIVSAFLQGFRYTYLVAAAVAFVGAAISAIHVSGTANLRSRN